MRLLSFFLSLEVKSQANHRAPTTGGEDQDLRAPAAALELLSEGRSTGCG